MNRRLLLLATAGALATPFAHNAIRCAGAGKIANILHDLRNADVAAVGDFYANSHPWKCDADFLATAFGRHMANDADVATLREALAARRREDFRLGRTVVLDGWVLAEAEAAACALAAL